MPYNVLPLLSKDSYYLKASGQHFDIPFSEFDIIIQRRKNVIAVNMYI